MLKLFSKISALLPPFSNTAKVYCIHNFRNLPYAEKTESISNYFVKVTFCCRYSFKKSVALTHKSKQTNISHKKNVPGKSETSFLLRNKISSAANVA